VIRRPLGRALPPAAGVALALTLAPFGACGGERVERASQRPADEGRRPAAVRSQRFPELLNVRPVRVGPRRYDFMVMVSSPYDSWRRFANGWRVLTAGGAVLAEQRLGRPHPDEQPFWRRQSGVRVPRTVRTVVFEGRDSRNGFGGRRLTVTLP
jgi:hypothetical protein